MFDRLPTRPLLQRGLGIATAGLLVAGSLFVPAAVHASGLPPTANPDTVSGTEDQDVVIAASFLLSNDTDAEDTLTVSEVGSPSHGTVSLSVDHNTVTFTPDADLCGLGAASFTYDAFDGDNGPSVATVTIDLACVNDAPVAQPDTEAGHQDDPLVMTDHDLVANDEDVDTDNNDLFIAGASAATNGSVAYNPITHDVTFTPTPGVCAPTDGGFTYTVSDGDKTDTAHVTVTLMCNGTNHTPVAANHTASGTEDTAVVSTQASLLAGATDADSDPLTISGVSNFVGGTAVLGATDVTFTPTANLCGSSVASYDYTVNDGQGGTDFGTLTISLDLRQRRAGRGRRQRLGQRQLGPGRLQRPRQRHGSRRRRHRHPHRRPSASTRRPPAPCSVVAGEVRFTPTAVFKGQAVITYHITDGHVVTPVAGTLTVDVGVDLTAPAVAVPTAAFGSGRVNESAPIRINWSATDAGSGVAKYQVQVSVGGGAFKAVYTGTGKAITKSYPFGKTLVWRVRATDQDGNVSGWVSSATRKIGAIQENNGGIHRTGTWSRVITHGASGTGYGFTSANHKAAGVQFSARGVLYVAPKSAAAGWVKVYVDGAPARALQRPPRVVRAGPDHRPRKLGHERHSQHRDRQRSGREARAPRRVHHPPLAILGRPAPIQPRNPTPPAPPAASLCVRTRRSPIAPSSTGPSAGTCDRCPHATSQGSLGDKGSPYVRHTT